MNTKGQGTRWFLGVIIAALLIFVVFVRPLSSTFVGDNSLRAIKERMESNMLNFVYELTESNSKPFDGKCTSSDAAISTNEIKQKIRTAVSRTKNPSIDVQWAMAMIDVETGGTFEHCNGNKVISSPTGSAGVMQITRGTANEVCGVGYDIADLQKNINCGVKIMQVKYLLVESDTKYELLVDRYCDASVYPNINSLYLSYKGHPERKMARAYNSLACDGAGWVAEDYVTLVERNIGKY